MASCPYFLWKTSIGENEKCVVSGKSVALACVCGIKVKSGLKKSERGPHAPKTMPSKKRTNEGLQLFEGTIAISLMHGTWLVPVLPVTAAVAEVKAMVGVDQVASVRERQIPPTHV